MELFDIYDADRHKTGEIVERGKMHERDGYHLSVHVCLFNLRDEMLIQQRQILKSGWSNYWDLSAGGCVVAGEDSRFGAEREVWEELGIRLDLSAGRPVLTVHFPGGFDDIYLAEWDRDLAELTLQKEEVKDVAWATQDMIFQMIDDGLFIPYHKSYIRLLFDMRRTGDVRREKDPNKHHRKKTGEKNEI